MNKFQAYLYIFICSLMVNFTLHCASSSSFSLDPRSLSSYRPTSSSSSASSLQVGADSSRGSMPAAASSSASSSSAARAAEEEARKKEVSAENSYQFLGLPVPKEGLVVFNEPRKKYRMGDLFLTPELETMIIDNLGDFVPYPFQKNEIGSSAGSLVLSRNEKELISGHVNGQLQVREKRNNGRFLLKQRIDTKRSAITCLVLSQDGKLLISGHENGYLQVRGKLGNQKLFGTPIEEIVTDSPVRSLVLTEQEDDTICLISGHKNGNIQIRRKGKNDDRFELRQIIPTHNHNNHFDISNCCHIQALVQSRDGRQLFSGHNDGGIQIRTQNTFGQPELLVNLPHSSPVRSLVLDENGRKTLISGHSDGHIRVWRAGNKDTEWRLIQEINTNNSLSSLIMSEDGTVLISAHEDGQIQIRKKSEDGRFCDQAIQTMRIRSTASLLLLSKDKQQLITGGGFSIKLFITEREQLVPTDEGIRRYMDPYRRNIERNERIAEENERIAEEKERLQREQDKRKKNALFLGAADKFAQKQQKTDKQKIMMKLLADGLLVASCLAWCVTGYCIYKYLTK